MVCAEAENSHYCERISVNYSLVCGSPTQVGFDDIASASLLLSSWVSSLCQQKSNPGRPSFPGGSVVKNLPVDAGDTRDVRSLGQVDPLE